MLDLVIFYGGFRAKAGGAYHHAECFLQTHNERKQETRIVTLDSLPFPLKYFPHIVEKLVNVFAFPLGYVAKGKVIKLFFRMLRIRANAYIFEDIYFSWNSSTPSVTILHAVWSDNLQGKKITLKQDNFLKKVEIKIINSITHPLVTVSKPYRKYLCDVHFLGCHLRNIQVVELGIRLLKISPKVSAEVCGKKIIYCGALEPRKNVRFLLEIMEALQAIDNEYSLTVVGDGVDQKMLVTHVKLKKLNVEFVGKLDYQEIPGILRQHQIYVHTSVKESFSFSLLEAKMMGLRTIAFEGLQVPSEFIDIGVADFKHSNWIIAIQAAQEIESKTFDLTRFDAENMVSRTMALFPPKQKALRPHG